ncbi:MAG TPA: SpoIVB peptidase [Symbiobacteriaceae bacterium]
MSTREKRRRAAGLFLIALFLTLCSTPQFRAFVAFPDHVRLAQGQAQDLTFRLPFRATVHAAGDGALALNGEPLGAQGSQAVLSTPLRIAALQTGRSTVDFRLFGLIPFRRLTVDVVPEIKVVPGGHSIGVLLKSRGVMVVGFAAIRDKDGVVHQPGMEAGIQVGDTILEINGKEVTSEEQAARLFEEAGSKGKPVKVTLKRKGKVITQEITPVREKESGRWRVGLYIRDGAAGVGTLTFYEPRTGTFGALGHMITDGGTNQPIEVKNGYIVAAEVTSVQKGRRGAPGEKIGAFYDEDNWLGIIEKNTRYGIFGKANQPITNPFYRDPVPVAMANQVKEGPAEILTVVEGQKMERFTVEIQRVIAEPTADGKNMIVKITDQRLLEKTGGIVQGMSGSPILQDGRMVGAITHVFVNDPTRGYGALIEWMLQEAGVLPARDAGVREEKPPGLLLYACAAFFRILQGSPVC